MIRRIAVIAVMVALIYWGMSYVHAKAVAEAQSPQDIWPYEISHFKGSQNLAGDYRNTRVFKQVYQGCEIFTIVAESRDATADSVAIALGRGCK